MATTFLEPGGDSDFQTPGGVNTFWPNAVTTPPDTVITHGGHLRSLQYRPSVFDRVVTSNSSLVIADSGTRLSLYLYIKALPTAFANIAEFQQVGGATVVSISLTSSGVLQLWNGNTSNQIGSNGATLNTGTWYRLSLAYTITSTTVNRFEFFVNGVSSISVTNATLTNITSQVLRIGVLASDATFDFRTSDHYIDDSNSLTDTGNIWVTAKRPNANGTTNGFTTQIGSGGSGYGTGHSPQVNERPLSTANGWSMIGAGSAITEEYNIEGQSVGDITTVGGTIVDYVGWVSASAALSETGQIVVNNVTSNIALTSTNTLFTKVAGSTSYPSGTGTDIGIVTSTTVTTVSLYECGVLVAFIPASTTTNQLAALGAG